MPITPQSTRKASVYMRDVWYPAHKEQIKEYQKKHREDPKFKEKRLAQKKEHYERNKELINGLKRSPIEKLEIYKHTRVHGFQNVRSKARFLMVMSAKSKGCSVCGYITYYGGLVFHHVDPNEKTGKTMMMGLDNLCEEIKKCVVLCHNCHHEYHAGLIDQSVIDDAKARMDVDVTQWGPM